jgi:hypothetical protein
MLTWLALSAEPLEASPPGAVRPLYLIRHCTNSIRRLEATPETGANAVELDLTFRRGEVRIGHPAQNPPACWCQHEKGDDVARYFREVAGMLAEEGPFELVILDIKRPDKDTAAFATTLARLLS